MHHLDYELLELDDSYHTQGFYKRESSLFGQLVPDPSRYGSTVATRKPKSNAELQTRHSETAPRRTAKIGATKATAARVEQAQLPFVDP